MAEYQESGCEAAQHEIFDGRFHGSLIALLEAGQGIARHGEHFEPQEYDQEIGRGDHDHHPGEREEEQGVVFPEIGILLPQVFHGDQDHENGGQRQD
jgi:hypothetical protein